MEQRRWGKWAFILIVGCLLRILALFLPWGALDLIDHAHFVAWEREIVERGMTKAYGQPYDVIALRLSATESSRSKLARYEENDGVPKAERVAAAATDGNLLRPGPDIEYVLRPNYGPAFLMVLTGVAYLHEVFDPELRPYTRIGLVLLTATSALFDLFLVLWLIPLGRFLGTRRGDTWKVFAWIWCNPAIILNETLRQQVDSWAIAWMVGSMLACVRGRWYLSGVCATLGLLTKPQAVLVLPFVLLVAIAREVERHSTSNLGSRRKQGLSGFLAFGLGVFTTFLLLGLPFQIGEGSAWFEASLLLNATDHPISAIGSEYAMNMWGAIQMLTGSYLSSSMIAGLSWKVWGGLLFTIFGGFAMAAWWSRYRLSARGWPILVLVLGVAGFFTVVGLSGRYLIFLIPFSVLGACGTSDRIVRLVLPWLSVLTTAHLTCYLWFPTARGFGFLAHDPPLFPGLVMWVGCASTTWFLASFCSQIRRRGLPDPLDCESTEGS